MTRRNAYPIAHFDDDAMREQVFLLWQPARHEQSDAGLVRGADLGSLLRWFRGRGHIGLDAAASMVPSYSLGAPSTTSATEVGQDRTTALVPRSRS